MRHERPSSFVFRLDAHDNIEAIVHVGQEMLVVPRDSPGAGPTKEEVVHRLRHRFITPQYLYSSVLKLVRDRRTQRRIRYLCERPSLRRVVELTVSPLGDRRLELEGRVIRTEPGPYPVSPEEESSAQLAPFITICAWCKAKVRSSLGVWIGVDEVVQDGSLFLASPSLKLTHGFCPSCLEELVRQVEE